MLRPGYCGASIPAALPLPALRPGTALATASPASTYATLASNPEGAAPFAALSAPAGPPLTCSPEGATSVTQPTPCYCFLATTAVSPLGGQPSQYRHVSAVGFDPDCRQC